MTGWPAAVLTLALVAGCGQGSSQESGREDAGPSWTRVAIVSDAAAGGTTSASPVRLDSPAALDDFVSQFERPGLGADVRRAVAAADVPAGHVPVGAVIAIGCDVPSEFTVATTEPVSVTADEVFERLRECLVPMTSVAVLTLDEGLVRPAAGGS